MLIWLLTAALAEPVPMQVPLVGPDTWDLPDVRVLGWTQSTVDGVPVELRVGATLLHTSLDGPFRTPCRCELQELACALRDDGAVGFELTDPHRAIAQDLGRCTLGEHSWQVQAVAGPPPSAHEVEPGRWIVPVTETEVADVGVVMLPKPKRWSLSGGSACALGKEKKAAVVSLAIATPLDDWLPCVVDKDGVEVWVRPVVFRARWEQPERPVVVPEVVPALPGGEAPAGAASDGAPG